MADDEGRTFMGFGVFFGDFTVDPEELASEIVDFGPGLDEMVGQAAEGARRAKQELVTNGPDDLPEYCIAVYPQGRFQCPIVQMCADMGMRPPDAIEMALSSLRSMLGRPIAVFVLLESVYHKVSDEHPLDEHVVGRMAEQWREGDPSIGEALTMVAATQDRYIPVFMPYHYGDGSVVWDDDSEMQPDEVEGWPDEVELDSNVMRAIAAAFIQEGGPEDGTE